MDNKELGEILRDLRERKGWTQEHVADLIGTTARTVGNWERGETSPRNKLGALSEVYGPDLRVISTGQVFEVKNSGDPVERAIKGSRLTLSNQHHLIGTYHEMLEDQERRRSG